MTTESYVKWKYQQIINAFFYNENTSMDESI